jgi:diacylglycerol kinase (ATP)
MATGFTIGARLKSIGFALAGIAYMIRTQHNAWLHLIATALVCALGVALKIQAADWRWLIVAITLVWVAEAMNTAFEHLCDVVSPEFHNSVKISKDVAAGAVLICALGAACLGALIFAPYLGLR